MATIVFAEVVSNALYGLLCVAGFLLFVALFITGVLYLRKGRKRARLNQVQMQDTVETSDELDRFMPEEEEEEEDEGRGTIQTKGPFGLTFGIKEVKDAPEA
jgi:hypothetical protein